MESIIASSLLARKKPEDEPERLTAELMHRTLTYRWVCLGLLFFSALLSFCIRLAPAVASPQLPNRLRC